MYLIKIEDFTSGKSGFYGKDEFGKDQSGSIGQARFFVELGDAECKLNEIFNSSTKPLTEKSILPGYWFPDKLIHQLSGVTIKNKEKSLKVSIVKLSFQMIENIELTVEIKQ